MNFDKVIYDENAISIIKSKALSFYNSEIPLGDKIFSKIEESDIEVLLYPIDDECDGFYIKKFLCGNEKSVIYINTAKPLHTQIFTAGHEVGHYLKIDEIVQKEYSYLKKEDIIDRFSAELLIPMKGFANDWNRCVKENKLDSKISIELLASFIFESMIKYYVNLDTILMRFIELKIIDLDVVEKYYIPIQKETDMVLSKNNSSINVATNKKYFSGLIDFANNNSNKSIEYALNRLIRKFDYNVNNDNRIIIDILGDSQ